MKTTSLALLASVVCATIAVAVDNDPAARQYQVYPKNLARQHVGSNLFVFNATNQTYVPTEASAAWLDDDATTGWPVLAGKQYYLLALAEPELVSNFSVSAKPSDGTISIFAGDEPAAPGARSWAPLAQSVPFNSVNEHKLAKPFTRFAKYLLIKTDLTNPGPLYSLYVYGEKPATIYTTREREQAIDARAIFGQYVNNQTTFNSNGLYGNSTITYANSPDGSTAWQKAIDDNPESAVALAGSATDPSAVISYGSPQSLSRVSVLTDGNAKGKLEFFAINDPSGATGTPSLDGQTPVASIVLDGTSSRASLDFPSVNATKLAIRWSPTVPNETISLREIGSFGSSMALSNYEVGMKNEAVAAYDASGADAGYFADGKDMKDPKDPKDPAEVAAGPPGGPYLPGALGFPPNLSNRIIRFVSQ